MGTRARLGQKAFGGGRAIAELGALGEFLGSVGVLIALIYLAVQVRQTKGQIESNTNALPDASFQVHQITFMQWKKGLLGDEYWEFCIRYLGSRCLAMPGVQEWWRMNESLFVAEYRQLITTLVQDNGWKNSSAYLDRPGAAEER